MRVAVVGAGVVGRLIAWRLARRGVRVSLFERRSRQDTGAASFVAAGMLAPLAEAVLAGSEIAAAGIEGLALWAQYVEELAERPLFRREGSVVAALPGDEAELEEFEARLARVMPQVRLGACNDLPDVEQRTLPTEGFIDTEAAMPALLAAAEDAGVAAHFGATPTQDFDWMVDARGLGAIADETELRGVRGEIIKVRAPELRLTRPVRVLHRRYPLYVVPRPGQTFLIGATQIESASTAPVSVQSALELLGAAYALSPALRYAEILATAAQVRPAYPDNVPRVFREGRRVVVNGLYRHGWMLGPVVAERAVALVLGGAA